MEKKLTKAEEIRQMIREKKNIPMQISNNTESDN